MSDLEKLRYVVLKGWGDEKGSVAVNDWWVVNRCVQPWGLKKCFSSAKFLVDRLVLYAKRRYTHQRFFGLKSLHNCFYSENWNEYW